jgi:hypothetical protein
MEVHHHSHHPKKWKEYITEFLMLFAAVTLGFLAENKREHYVEGLKEVQYMKSLMEDLSKDKFDLNESLNFTKTQILYYDTAINLLSAGKWTPDNTMQLYRVSLKLGGSRPTTFVERTSSQLKSGGMRIVQNRKVATLLATYWQLIDQLNDFESVSLNGYKQNLKNMNYKIFDGKNYIDPKNKIIKEDATLMTYDSNYLLEYNNRLLDLRYSLNYTAVQFFYENLNKTITELQKAIADAYEIPIQNGINVDKS